MRDGKNGNKTSYKKIIMMFLISKPSPNCLFSSHQTIDGQWDCAYLQLKLLQCWQLNVYAEQNNGAVPFLSPELAVFSTGHEEYVRELCTRRDLHVKFVLFAGLEVPCGGQKFTLGHGGSADHCRVIHCWLLWSWLHSSPPHSFDSLKKLLTRKSPLWLLSASGWGCFPPWRFLHPWPWDYSPSPWRLIMVTKAATMGNRE